MTTEEQDERRKAAVQAFEQREAEAAGAKADRDAAQKNRAAALAQENAKWKAQTQVIRLGVMASSNGFFAAGIKIPDRATAQRRRKFRHLRHPRKRSTDERRGQCDLLYEGRLGAPEHRCVWVHLTSCPA